MKKARAMKRYVGLKICAVLAALAILGVAEVAEADFLISLRNGKEIRVRRYEEVGNQIVYARYGGKIAIPKTRVATIEDLQTGEKRVFERFGTAQEPKATPRAYTAKERKRPSSAREALWEDLNVQAASLYEKGRYAEAATKAREALTVAEKTFGPNHPHVATSLNILALLYRLQGKYAAVEPLHKRALRIREKALGPEHSEVAESLNNLAALYQSQAKYAAAEPLYKRALAIDEKILGGDHPNIARELNNLGELYRVQGKYAAAEPLYIRAVAIGERALAAGDPQVAVYLNNLALVYESQRRYADAEILSSTSGPWGYRRRPWAPTIPLWAPP